MKNLVLACLSIFACLGLVLSVFPCSPSLFAGEIAPSGTQYVAEALKPLVESGELPGAISILEKDGKRETCCIGYANVEKKIPMALDSLFMQCSQTKGFCGVTVAISSSAACWTRWRCGTPVSSRRTRGWRGTSSCTR